MNGVIFASGSCASSHTYGNVVSLIREYIESHFPKGFFKYSHISSELITRDQRLAKINSDAEHVKRLKPAIFYKLMFDGMDQDIPFSGTQLTSALGGSEPLLSRRHLQQFIRDDENGLELRFKMNRDKMTFEMNIHLDTQIKQIDVYKHMQNTLNWYNKFYIPCHLESMIPREMIYYFADVNHIDMSQPGASTLLLRYLNKNTNSVSYPVTYKMRTSTSRDEYFLYYNANVEVSLTDLTMEPLQMKNKVIDYAAITFRAEVQFNMPGVYYMLKTKDIPNIDYSLRVDSGIFGSEFIPIFTLDKLYEIPNEKGFKVYNNTIIKTEEDLHHKDDSFIFKELFTQDFLNLIKVSNDQGIDTSNFLDILLIKNRELMVNGTDYDIEWENFNIIIHDSDPDATYRLMVYFDNHYVADRLTTAIELDTKERDKGVH